MRVLLDTALLLNDFFHRNPAAATRRGGPSAPAQLEDAWQRSHEALLALSLRPAVFVCVAEYTVLRLATILSDLQLPAETVLEELRYWSANFRLLAFSAGEAEAALEMGLAMNQQPGRPAEDYLLAHLARREEISYILSPQQRAAPLLGDVEFVSDVGSI